MNAKVIATVEQSAFMERRAVLFGFTAFDNRPLSAEFCAQIRTPEFNGPLAKAFH